jgi:N-acetylglucosaminyl-diphospho-decaprenol L-rhamnosyltransferase
MAQVSVIIVSWNTAALLRQCLLSLLSGKEREALKEVIVVDNCSSDGSAEMVEGEFPQVRLIRNDENEGFARANNRGIDASTGDFVLLLNSDAVAGPETIAGLTQFMESHPDAGACGPRLVKPGGSSQAFSYGSDPSLPYLFARALNRTVRGRFLHDWGGGEVKEVGWVSGACLMARKRAIDDVGLLDEKMFMYFEDNDWCLRMRGAGWKVYFVPLVSVVHFGGQSLAKNPDSSFFYDGSLKYFYRKHYGPLSQLALSLSLPFYRCFARIYRARRP